MGSTVFNAARIKSRLTATGQIAYLWEENTHCIKDGPTNANWCAMAFGNKADIIRRIYGLASSIPGGMLKANRTVTAFVDAMLKLVEEPQELAGETVRLENHSKGFYTAIHDFNRGAIRQYLRDHGRADLAGTIAETQEKPTHVVFSLDTDFEVLRGIVNDLEYNGVDINDRPSLQRGMAVWKVFGHCGSCGTGNPGPFEQAQSTDKAKTPDLKIYSTGINIGYGGASQVAPAHIVTIDGNVIYVGSLEYNHYQLTSSVVEKAGAIHIATGHNVLRQLIKSCKSALEAPLAVPADAVFSFCTSSEPWVNKNIEVVRQKLGKPTGSGFSATAEELAQVSAAPFNELRYLLGSGFHDKVLSIEGLSKQLQ